MNERLKQSLNGRYAWLMRSILFVFTALVIGVVGFVSKKAIDAAPKEAVQKNEARLDTLETGGAVMNTKLDFIIDELGDIKVTLKEHAEKHE
jgi:hypothetical protein